MTETDRNRLQSPPPPVCPGCQNSDIRLMTLIRQWWHGTVYYCHVCSVEFDEQGKQVR